MLALVAIVLPFAVLASCQSEKVGQTSEINENSVSLVTMRSFYNDCLKQPVIVPNVTSTRAVNARNTTLAPVYLESLQPLLRDEAISKKILLHLMMLLLFKMNWEYLSAPLHLLTL